MTRFSIDPNGEWDTIHTNKPDGSEFIIRRIQPQPRNNAEIAADITDRKEGLTIDYTRLLNAIDAKIAAATEKLREEIESLEQSDIRLSQFAQRLEARIAALEDWRHKEWLR